jgi:solute carrier family 25 (mitochondrial carnitine/acylcarnitine transporter), member 20/29
MGSPLVTVPVINSIVFSSFELAKRMMGLGLNQESTFKQNLLAGMFAGFTNSFVLSPIELIKCRLQIQRESKATAYYKGPIDCLQKIVREEGIPNGVFKGLVSSFAREIPCYAGQFASFYYTKCLMAKLSGVK